MDTSPNSSLGPSTQISIDTIPILSFQKPSLSSANTKVSLSIQATNTFQSCLTEVITGSFWLNLKVFPEILQTTFAMSHLVSFL